MRNPLSMGDFQVAFRFCFKASPSAKSHMKIGFIYM